MDFAGPGQAGDRPLLADRNRLAGADGDAGHRRDAREVRQPVLPRLWLRPEAAARVRLERGRGGRKGRRGDRAAVAARLHVDPLERRRAIREDLFLHDPGPRPLYNVRLGHPRQGWVLLHPGTYRRRDQCGRASPRDAGDRRGGEHAPWHCRVCGCRGGRPAQGPVADGVRRGQGSFPGGHGRGEHEA